MEQNIANIYYLTDEDIYIYNSDGVYEMIYLTRQCL